LLELHYGLNQLKEIGAMSSFQSPVTFIRPIYYKIITNFHIKTETSDTCNSYSVVK